tara:strand:+ start:3217 stop:3444 length:228 start_codon:yes stop_codon:yes gene_type:complete
MKQLFVFAQDVVLSPGNTLGLGAVVLSGIAAVYGWFRTELNDCKKDRKDLYAKVDALHENVSALSMRVGNVERQH